MTVFRRTYQLSKVVGSMSGRGCVTVEEGRFASTGGANDRKNLSRTYGARDALKNWTSVESVGNIRNGALRGRDHRP